MEVGKLELTGEIVVIIFSNESNGYKVCELKTDSGRITIVRLFTFCK